jgi:hypothetical protein
VIVEGDEFLSPLPALFEQGRRICDCAAALDLARAFRTGQPRPHAI